MEWEIPNNYSAPSSSSLPRVNKEAVRNCHGSGLGIGSVVLREGKACWDFS